LAESPKWALFRCPQPGEGKLVEILPNWLPAAFRIVAPKETAVDQVPTSLEIPQPTFADNADTANSC
jgi:hypothetical protein